MNKKQQLGKTITTVYGYAIKPILNSGKDTGTIGIYAGKKMVYKSMPRTVDNIVHLQDYIRNMCEPKLLVRHGVKIKIQYSLLQEKDIYKVYDTEGVCKFQGSDKKKAFECADLL